MKHSELSFEIKTGIKNIIGRDLITDDYIAIFELVKNSYDAHAKNVIITFEEKKIIIADDGKGMSENDLRNKWFAVAYSAKKDGTEDSEDEEIRRGSYRDSIKSKRFYAGAKGIGRFSCDKLGSNLILTTCKIGTKQLNQVTINWDTFEENFKENFSNIKVPFNVIEGYNISFPCSSTSGTILEIANLENQWNSEKIRTLKHSLEKLINPFSETNDFNIEIISERDKENDNKGVNEKGKPIIDRDKINGLVKNTILDILNLKTTQLDVEIINNQIITKLSDRGALIYHITESNIYIKFIDNLRINIYYLNHSAKINFGKKMGIMPVNYGSVFLFKNGFRVQPYGNKGDDSWGLDYRNQQGYNRFLSTRDLFGRVDIATENFEQFKEVSSRDGGLVETIGYTQLMEAVWEKGFRRLERYVVGVLWGEAFLRKKYFTSDNEGKKLREKLLSTDKESDNYVNAVSNIGSKLDFVQLIKSLSDDENIKILDYDKKLLDFVNENLDDVQPKFLKDLEKIAERTDNEILKKQVKLTDDSFKKLEQEKEEALKKADIEEQKRKEAEKRAAQEAEKRKLAEEKAKHAEDKRREAELATERKEKERYKAELEKLVAEQKAREEEEKRKLEESKNEDLKNKLSFEEQKNQYLNATRKTLSDDAEQLVHSIDLYVGNASSYLTSVFENNEGLANNIKEELYFIKSNLDKALKVSQIIIKSSFDYKSIKQRIDLAKYIEEYFEDSGIARKDKIKINVNNKSSYLAFLNTLDIDIIIDNLVSNSIKAKSKNILVEIYKEENKLNVDYFDDGKGIPDKFLRNKDAMFQLGTRDSDEKGSGIGMYDVKKRISNLKGTIDILGNNIKLKGAGFRLIL